MSYNPVTFKEAIHKMKTPSFISPNESQCQSPWKQKR